MFLGGASPIWILLINILCYSAVRRREVNYFLFQNISYMQRVDVGVLLLLLFCFLLCFVLFFADTRTLSLPLSLSPSLSLSLPLSFPLSPSLSLFFSLYFFCYMYLNNILRVMVIISFCLNQNFLKIYSSSNVSIKRMGSVPKNSVPSQHSLQSN